MGDTVLACFGRIPWTDRQGVRRARRRQSDDVDDDGDDGDIDGSDDADRDGGDDENNDEGDVDSNGGRMVNGLSCAWMPMKTSIVENWGGG